MAKHTNQPPTTYLKTGQDVPARHTMPMSIYNSNLPSPNTAASVTKIIHMPRAENIQHSYLLGCRCTDVEWKHYIMMWR